MRTLLLAIALFITAGSVAQKTSYSYTVDRTPSSTTIKTKLQQKGGTTKKEYTITKNGRLIKNETYIPKQQGFWHNKQGQLVKESYTAPNGTTVTITYGDNWYNGLSSSFGSSSRRSSRRSSNSSRRGGSASSTSQTTFNDMHVDYKEADTIKVADTTKITTYYL